MSPTRLNPLLETVRRLGGAGGRQEQTDGQLLHRFRAEQDEAAYTELLRRHGGMVLRVCRRVLGNAHDAEDAFQATFLTLARKAPSVRQAHSLGSWLYGVAHHTAQRLRDAARRRQIHETRAAAQA